MHIYPREDCVTQSLKALRDKELLVVLLDQNTGGKSGVYVDFFGQKAGQPRADYFCHAHGGAIITDFYFAPGR